MYRQFYNLTGNPFQLSPNADFYFGGRTHSKAMAYLVYGLDQGEGFILITGEIGAGKTTVISNLLATLDQDRYLIGSIVTPSSDPNTILRLAAAGFGIDCEGNDNAWVLSKIQALLTNASEAGKKVILIVDDAQDLSDASLEQLRVLLNYQRGNQALMQIILVGQPELRARLATSPFHEQIRQRVIATCHLMPLASAEETGRYIEHRLAVAGYTGEPIFTEGAIAAVHVFTNGIPRRINQLASRLLLQGFLAQQHVIDTAEVEEVIAEMQAEWDPDPLGTSRKADEADGRPRPALAWDKNGTG